MVDYGRWQREAEELERERESPHAAALFAWVLMCASAWLVCYGVVKVALWLMR